MTNKNNSINCKVTEILPIDDAEEWEIAILDDNYQVVVKKDSVSEGESKVFVPSGSWIPHEALDMGKEPSKFKGIEGNYLPIFKRSGIWNEGLIFDPNGEVKNFLFPKWQREIPDEFMSKGENLKTFPIFLRSPEISNCQEIGSNIFSNYSDHTFEITPLFDGVTVIFYIKDGKFGICTSKYEVQERTNDILWKFAYEHNIAKTMLDSDTNFALYGVIYGNEIYTNPDKLKNRKYFIYDIYDIDNKKFVNNNSRYNTYVQMCEDVTFEHIPVFSKKRISEVSENIQELLDYSEGTSMNPYSDRKGLVFKSLKDPDIRFKVLSRKFRYSHKL